jgi:hypothetical protein
MVGRITLASVIAASVAVLAVGMALAGSEYSAPPTNSGQVGIGLTWDEGN